MHWHTVDCVKNGREKSILISGGLEPSAPSSHTLGQSYSRASIIYSHWSFFLLYFECTLEKD